MRYRAVTAALLGLGVLLLLGPIRESRGAPSRVIQHQGRLTDSNGVPLEGTIERLAFRLYSTATPTSSTFVWGEVHENVAVRRGVFTIYLGAGTKTLDVNGAETPGPNPFVAEFEEGSARFIELQVGSDAPLTPLAPLASVPYALSAGGMVPLGGIIAWWPASPGAAVPEGFEYCDGGNVMTPDSPFGTAIKPDLMSSPRFPRGALLSTVLTGEYGRGKPIETGGVDQVADHAHGLSNHQHAVSLTTTTDGQHNHGGVTGPETHHEFGNTTGELYLNFGTRDHDHPIAQGGAHGHQVSGNTGGAQGSTTSDGHHDNRPAFVSLAYIIRVK
jgi:hypothetical protein